MSGQTKYADWIAVDWGTSNLRVWAMQGDEPRDLVTSDQGMSSLSRDAFEPTLISLIDGWLGTETTPVIACGMVGSRQGWIEAPYRAVPTTPLGSLCQVTCNDPRIETYILPGLKQTTHPDVMRGEETQIAGFLTLEPDFDGVLCLPGTHSKWVRISAGEIVSFQTFMTGEIFDLLGTRSVLRHSTASTENWDETAFLETISTTLSRPEQLAAKLFQIRSASLLDGVCSDVGRASLSGLLLGAELAGAKPYWLGQDIALIGHPDLTELYSSALNSLAISARQYAGNQMTLKGLADAYRHRVK